MALNKAVEILLCVAGSESGIEVRRCFMVCGQKGLWHRFVLRSSGYGKASQVGDTSCGNSFTKAHEGSADSPRNA